MAVERRAKLIIALEDLMSGKVKDITDLYSAMKIVVEGVNQTFGRLKDFVVESVKAFAESEQATIRLNNALKNQGFYTEEYSKSLQQQAKDLSKVSTASDETIMDTQTLLTTFGLAGEQLTKTTKAALDLSAGLNIDLRTATLMLGKAWAGETQTLGRYGFKVDETATTLEKFAQLQDQVNSRFGGRAAADAQSYTGKIEKLAEAWNNLQEKIGEDFARSSEKSITNLTKLTEKIEENYTAVSGWVKGVGIGTLMGNGLFGQIMALVGAYKGMGEAAEQAAAKAAAGPGAPGPASKPAADPEGEAKLAKLNDELLEEEFATSESARRRLEELTMTAAQREQIQTESLARQLAAEGMQEESIRLLNAQSVENARRVAKDRMTVMLSSLQSIASLSNAKTKELQVIGKAAAISMALVNAHQGAALALGTIPPPFGFIMAGLVEAAGIAQAAQIAGVPLAEGGVGMARMGGIPATIAENRKDEAIIPLDDERTAEKLRASGLGGGDGGTTHVWHVGVLVADEGGLMELARRMDEKLFALERRGSRVSG